MNSMVVEVTRTDSGAAKRNDSKLFCTMRATELLQQAASVGHLHVAPRCLDTATFIESRSTYHVSLFQCSELITSAERGQGKRSYANLSPGNVHWSLRHPRPCIARMRGRP